MLHLILYKIRKHGQVEFWNGNSWTRDHKKAKAIVATRESVLKMDTLYKKLEKNNMHMTIAMCSNPKKIDMTWFSR